MIIVFPRHPAGGSGRKAVDYLVNKQDREEVAVVLRGDPEKTKQLIDGLEFEHKYTFGVLSFEPGAKVGQAAEQDIMNRFERAAFAGLSHDKYNILWVRHTDKGHHELHFVVPRVELSTGKSLNIKPPGTEKFIDTLGDSINFRYGYADPRAAMRAREVWKPHHVEKLDAEMRRRAEGSAKDAREFIHEQLERHVDGQRASGKVLKREDLVEHLQNEGLEVPRQGSNYITVKVPDTDKRWRLKGEMFKADWSSDKEKAIEVERTIADGVQLEKAREADRTLKVFVEKRAEYNRKKFGIEKESMNVSAPNLGPVEQVASKRFNEKGLSEEDKKAIDNHKEVLLMRLLDAQIEAVGMDPGNKKRWKEESKGEDARRLREDVVAFVKAKDASLLASSLETIPLARLVSMTETRQQAKNVVIMKLEENKERLQDRKAVATYLEMQGFEINRTGKDYLSVRLPETNQLLRLRGRMFEEGWKYSKELANERDGKSYRGITALDRNPNNELEAGIGNLVEARKELEGWIEHRQQSIRSVEANESRNERVEGKAGRDAKANAGERQEAGGAEAEYRSIDRAVRAIENILGMHDDGIGGIDGDQGFGWKRKRRKRGPEFEK